MFTDEYRGLSFLLSSSSERSGLSQILFSSDFASVCLCVCAANRSIRQLGR